MICVFVLSYIRSSFSSERINGILSRNFSKESTLKWLYRCIRLWRVRKTHILTKIYWNIYPNDCKPPINSCLENSHIVPAFMCHERTNCKDVNIPSKQKHSHIMNFKHHASTIIPVHMKQWWLDTQFITHLI